MGKAARFWRTVKLIGLAPFGFLVGLFGGVRKQQKADAEAEKKKIAKAALAKNDVGDSNSSEKPVKKTTAVQSGSGKGTSAGANGQSVRQPPDSASEFGWYGSLLNDRFYSEWIQPTTVISSGA